MAREERWTAPTIRAHLGERGFIQDTNTIHDEEKGVHYSSFERGEDELTLVEFDNGAEPIVTQHGKHVRVADIGYRNEQIQHKPLLGD